MQPIEISIHDRASFNAMIGEDWDNGTGKALAGSEPEATEAQASATEG